jgi:chaperone BCS1
MVHEFYTTSSFDNFFSEEAVSVRAELETFLNGKAMYERIGRPWNYSILNTGSPGVGKTKLVKAIAALTGRTLIVLNLQHITTPLLLQQVFHSSILSGIKLPHEKRLYYIPEVDTQLLEVAKKREKKPEPAVVIGPVVNEKQKEPELKPSITLGDILNVLDGIPERNGHILVLDTNRLEELDPALVRPGRIDRVIEWKKISSACGRRMMEHFYETKIPVSIKIPDQKWSAAELHAILHRSASLKEALPLIQRK